MVIGLKFWRLSSSYWLNFCSVLGNLWMKLLRVLKIMGTTIGHWLGKCSRGSVGPHWWRWINVNFGVGYIIYMAENCQRSVICEKLSMFTVVRQAKVYPGWALDLMRIPRKNLSNPHAVQNCLRHQLWFKWLLYIYETDHLILVM